MSQLTIYKASAGSGKTYRITGEYLKLLFENPEKYRHILGVTFTNKATAEMKSRIIKELYKLSLGDNSGYMMDLTRTTQKKPEEIIFIATSLLNRILHDYSHFTITTIDSFFQSVIRNFSREIGILQDFEIELDQEKVLQAAIDEMIFNINRFPELKEWLVRFAENKIVEGRSWNIVGDIQSLGSELFKESYKEISENLQQKILNKDFLQNYTQKLKDFQLQTEKKVEKITDDAKKIIFENNLTSDDFKGKSRGIGAFFIKLSENGIKGKWNLSQTVRNCLNSPEEWYPVKSENQAIIEGVYSSLNQHLEELIFIYDNDYVVYKSISKVQRNLYVLGLVADLQVHIREYTHNKNLFLISDTAQFLNKLIDGSDAPFIYERTGTYIQHFMIDEFQDTSVLQWENFKPLIINSLAEANQNWVVGDVKQSIYRWRNSDWTILSDKIANEIAPHPIKIETLNYNWRSATNIVKFNNSFFKNALCHLSAVESHSENTNTEAFTRVLQSAYADFEQWLPDSKLQDEGLVNLELIDADSKRSKDWKNQVLEKLPSIIMKLSDSGYSLSDIAILVRDKKDAGMISDYLLNIQQTNKDSHYRFDILSGDSLLLKNAMIVKWLISCLKYVHNPGDDINNAFLLYQYHHFVKNNIDLDINWLYDENQELIFDGYLTGFFKEIHQSPDSIFELTDKLVYYFGLQNKKQELPYLQAFQDLLYQYSKRESSDIHSFLSWWEEQKDKQVIVMPENQDAIKLMTLHSSKGLEFPVVIIPFSDWEIIKTTKSNNYIWCKPNVEPINEMELLPLNMSSGLENTIFNDDYLREKALLYVDNLNLLYVAFTRAIKILYCFIPDYSEDEIKNNIASLIKKSITHQCFQTDAVNFPATDIAVNYKENEKIYSFGTLSAIKPKSVSETDIFLNNMDYSIRDISDVTQQVLNAQGYFGDKNDQLSSQLNSGKILHEIFQNIYNSGDVPRAMLKIYSEGKIVQSDIPVLENNIQEFLNNPKVSDWFRDIWKVKNESTIILENGTQYRPDRVLLNDEKVIVIDYKFGEEEKVSHQEQVSQYMKILSKMGYDKAEGYVWYVTKNKVVPVVVPVQGTLF